MADDKFELSQVIVKLREELLEAQKQGEDKDLRFRVEDIEVELQMVAEREGSGKMGVKWWVYNAEAAGKLSSQVTQKLKFKLKPETAEGSDFTVESEVGKGTTIRISLPIYQGRSDN